MRVIKRGWAWTKATRKHRVISGVLATFVVAGAALGYYVAVIQDGTGTVKYPNALGANNSPPTTFTIKANPSVVPTNLQPGADPCKGSNGAGTMTSLGNNCGGFNLYADLSGTTVPGTINSVTLTGVTLPTGCKNDSIAVIWPDGTEAKVNSDGSIGGAPTYNESATLQGPGGQLTFTANGPTNFEMFPPFSGAATPSAQPLLEFLDDGTNQQACAGGEVDMTFSAHATAS